MTVLLLTDSKRQPGRLCEGCGTPLSEPSGRGRKPKWCSQRCRKQTLYAGQCVDCGARTNGYDGIGKASARCRQCDLERRSIEAKWTAEAIVQAVKDFVVRYGHTPRATDWNPSQALERGHPERAERWRRDGCWPHQMTVQGVCGSMGEAIEAAGFTRRGPGERVAPC